MKHERDIRPAPKPNWRLKKTLSRRVEFRPIEAEDVRFAYAAYKKGALADMGPPFDQTEMTAAEFNVAFQSIVTTRYHGTWTLFATTKKGLIPVGMVLAFYSHSDPALAPFMIIGDMPWFPWATARNRIEAAVHFFNTIRTSIPMVDYAQGDTNKRFFEMICQHAVMRRVGTTFNVVKGEAVAVFETRVG